VSEPYRPKLIASTAPAWLRELRTRLEEEKAAEKATRKAKAAMVQQEADKRRRQKRNRRRRDKFIKWFAETLD